MEKACFVIPDLQALDRLCAALSHALDRGHILSLEGQLGAGKTAFVTRLAHHLAVPPDEVSSPTFTLLHEYEGRLPVYHFDVYRLRSPQEFLDLGFEEYLADGRGVCLIEWGNLVCEYLPDDCLRLVFSILPDGKQRELRASAGGPLHAALLADWVHHWQGGEAT